MKSFEVCLFFVFCFVFFSIYLTGYGADILSFWMCNFALPFVYLKGISSAQVAIHSSIVHKLCYICKPHFHE